MTFYQGYGEIAKKLFFSDYSESISSHHGFLTFLGNNRTSNDGQLQYYLYDLNKKSNMTMMEVSFIYQM